MPSGPWHSLSGNNCPQSPNPLLKPASHHTPTLPSSKHWLYPNTKLTSWFLFFFFCSFLHPSHSGSPWPCLFAACLQRLYSPDPHVSTVSIFQTRFHFFSPSVSSTGCTILSTSLCCSSSMSLCKIAVKNFRRLNKILECYLCLNIISFGQWPRLSDALPCPYVPALTATQTCAALPAYPFQMNNLRTIAVASELRAISSHYKQQISKYLVNGVWPPFTMSCWLKAAAGGKRLIH